MVPKRKHLLLKAILMISFISRSVLATGTVNEFKLQAVNYDSLAKHNRNCTSVLDEAVAVIFCEDGYMSIDDSANFVNPYSTLQNKANVTLDNKGSPKDIRLGKFLSMVDPRGEKLTIVRKTDLKTHGIYLDSDAGDSPVLLGGQFSADFVLFYISFAGSKFI